MGRRHRPKKLIFIVFAAITAALPAAAALQKQNNSVQPSAAFEQAATASWHSEDGVLWNVRSDGYGWEAETDPTEAASAAPAEDAGEKPYPETWHIDEGTAVQRTSYGLYTGTRFFSLSTAGQVQNKTSLSNSELLVESEMAPAFTIDAGDAPQVLIMHTHTTEAFEPFVRSGYDSSFNYRTTDPAYNIVSVGDAITEQLQDAGIGVIHDTTIHDYPSYNGSYDRSAETVRSYLAKYPTIKVVLDIHRDAIQKDNTLIQPIAEIDGKEAAQVMIISGCDDGTMDMPDYMQNFHFACRLQGEMEGMYPGLTRPILFDYRHYNQDLTTGSLLIEIGSHGNTLEQVQYSGELVGKALAQTLQKLRKNE